MCSHLQFRGPLQSLLMEDTNAWYMGTPTHSTASRAEDVRELIGERVAAPLRPTNHNGDLSKIILLAQNPAYQDTVDVWFGLRNHQWYVMVLNALSLKHIIRTSMSPRESTDYKCRWRNDATDVMTLWRLECSNRAKRLTTQQNRYVTKIWVQRKGQPPRFNQNIQPDAIDHSMVTFLNAQNSTSHHEATFPSSMDFYGWFFLDEKTKAFLTLHQVKGDPSRGTMPERVVRVYIATQHPSDMIHHGVTGFEVTQP